MKVYFVIYNINYKDNAKVADLFCKFNDIIVFVLKYFIITCKSINIITDKVESTLF